MEITLTESEIRAALIKLTHEKINHVCQSGDDLGTFVINGGSELVNDLESIKFTVDFGEDRWNIEK